ELLLGNNSFQLNPTGWACGMGPAGGDFTGSGLRGGARVMRRGACTFRRGPGTGNGGTSAGSSARAPQVLTCHFLATDWSWQTLPIGHGRIAASCFGGIDLEAVTPGR